MKVQHVAYGPSKEALDANCHVLEPELMSSVGARYSRNDNGLDEIIALIDPEDTGKSIDRIFKMTDYGHASIADMAPVAIFIDKISIYLTYYIWSICPRASGQETSTRYVKFDESGILSPDLAGVKENDVKLWNAFISGSISRYNTISDIWSRLATNNPSIMGIPQSLIDESFLTTPEGEKAQKKIDRLRRNFVFDRSRYWIPAAALTNAMLVMPGLDWVRLLQTLRSHYNLEANALAELLAPQLELVIPRLMKHSISTQENIDALRCEFEKDSEGDFFYLACESDVKVNVTQPHDFHLSHNTNNNDLSFSYHSHRYSPALPEAKRVHVAYSIFGVALAEIRDLNRHRTGYKYSPINPVGFYEAFDQVLNIALTLARDENAHSFTIEELYLYTEAQSWGIRWCEYQSRILQKKNTSSVYWGLLGTKYIYEHGTTLDKMVYEIELRTGLGSHYRYRKHMLDVYGKLIEQLPELEDVILIGSGEPE